MYVNPCVYPHDPCVLIHVIRVCQCTDPLNNDKCVLMYEPSNNDKIISSSPPKQKKKICWIKINDFSSLCNMRKALL